MPHLGAEEWGGEQGGLITKLKISLWVLTAWFSTTKLSNGRDVFVQKLQPLRAGRDCRNYTLQPFRHTELAILGPWVQKIQGLPQGKTAWGLIVSNLVSFNSRHLGCGNLFLGVN